MFVLIRLVILFSIVVWFLFDRWFYWLLLKVVCVVLMVVLVLVIDFKVVWLISMLWDGDIWFEILLFVLFR